jgi:hypothetical protein
MTEARKGLAPYFKFYNEKRWHQNFDRKTPSMVYFEALAQKQAAAWTSNQSSFTLINLCVLSEESRPAHHLLVSAETPQRRFR